jgi:hypothetical protein
MVVRTKKNRTTRGMKKTMTIANSTEHYQIGSGDEVVESLTSNWLGEVQRDPCRWMRVFGVSFGTRVKARMG